VTGSIGSKKRRYLFDHSPSFVKTKVKIRKRLGTATIPTYTKLGIRILMDEEIGSQEKA
jgi:hypothetical protein